jgi:hypothetical protein
MLGLLMGMVVGCGTTPEATVVSVEAAPAAAVAPVDIETSDLLGTPPPAVMPGLGMRGEGPQNGGPTYGPRLGEVPPGGLGTGSYGTPKKDAAVPTLPGAPDEETVPPATTPKPAPK